MKFIVITPPEFIANEAERICQLFRLGIDLLHLRKPFATEEACAGLLQQIPPEYRRRIVAHDHFGLAASFGLHGIHLNRRHPAAPPSFNGTISCSCHSLGEAAERKEAMDYVFLSPVFDSISKHGYRSAYTHAQMEHAAGQGIIDNRVIALGGVALEHIPLLRSWHFGGAAFLGDVWKRPEAEMPQHIGQLSAALSTGRQRS